MLVGGRSDTGRYLDDVTEYGEEGLVRELPKLQTARRSAACGAVGQVRRLKCSKFTEPHNVV